MVGSLEAGAESIGRGLMSMSMNLEITNQQYSVMESLTSTGGIFSGSGAKKLFMNSLKFQSQVADGVQGPMNQVGALFKDISKRLAENSDSVTPEWIANQLKENGVPGFESGQVTAGVTDFYEKAVANKSNFEALMNAKNTLETASSEWFTTAYNASKWAAGKAMLAYQMYDLTNQFISDATYILGMKNTSYTGLRRVVPIVAGVASVFAFPAIASGLATMYGGAKLVGHGLTSIYTLIHMTVVGTACGALGVNSEGCEKVTKAMNTLKKSVQKHAAKIPKYILYAIAGEKLAATLATSQYVTTLVGSNVLSTYFSGTIVTGVVSGISGIFAQASGAVITKSIALYGLAAANPMTMVAGAVVVGALAVGGIKWYVDRKKQQYDKTRKHLLRGGKVVLPKGWHMWVHPQAASLWFAHPESGRIQDVFPTETEFVDKRGRRVADMTLEFGINRPTKKQEVLARRARRLYRRRESDAQGTGHVDPQQT